jgi:hypothetical protein
MSTGSRDADQAKSPHAGTLAPVGVSKTATASSIAEAKAHAAKERRKLFLATGLIVGQDGTVIST